MSSIKTSQRTPRHGAESNMSSPAAPTLPLWTLGRNLLGYLPGEAVLAPFAAAFGGTNGSFAWSWLALMLLAWLNGVFTSFWKLAKPVDRLLAYAYIDSVHLSNDPSYSWLMDYWRHHPSFRQARAFITETCIGNSSSESGLQAVDLSMRSTSNGSRHGALQLDTSAEDLDAQPALKIEFKPNDEEAIWFWRHGTLFQLKHTFSEQSNMAPTRWNATPVKIKMITVRVFAFTRTPLIDLLREAQLLSEKRSPSTVSIYKFDDFRSWDLVATKRKRAMRSIKTDEEIKRQLLSDARDFLASERWYSARGIPWRRGYMFHGKPGTGKSSTILALASDLDVPIYLFPYASSERDDSLLARAMQKVPARCILVLEDVDAIKIPKRDIDRDEADELKPLPPVLSEGESERLSLSAILNCIDGVDSNEGRLLIMTSNDPDKLDPALIRPGRCDLFFEFRYATREQATHLFTDFYADLGDRKSGKHQQIESLAKQWVKHIDDREFSMAALQGMLLPHKKDPESAIASMADWTIRQREIKRNKTTKDAV